MTGRRHLGAEPLLALWCRGWAPMGKPLRPQPWDGVAKEHGLWARLVLVPRPGPQLAPNVLCLSGEALPGSAPTLFHICKPGDKDWGPSGQPGWPPAGFPGGEECAWRWATAGALVPSELLPLPAMGQPLIPAIPKRVGGTLGSQAPSPRLLSLPPHPLVIRPLLTSLTRAHGGPCPPLPPCTHSDVQLFQSLL